MRAFPVILAGLAVAAGALLVPDIRAAWPAAHAGCYALTRGPWSAGWGQPRWTDASLGAHRVPPARFTLHAAPVSDAPASPWAGWRQVSPVSNEATPREPGMPEVRGMWQRGPGDTLRVLWSDGYGGVELALYPAAGRNTLRGEVRAVHDVRWPPAQIPHAPAVAVRVPCPAA